MGPGGVEAPDVQSGQQTVLKLTGKLRNKNYRVYSDNYFASISLSEELLRRRTLGCGTLQSNHKGLPQDL